MNIKLLLVALLLAVIAKAQTVAIPDLNFKNYLLSYTQVDTNADGEIQLSEAEAVDSLTLECYYLLGEEYNNITNLSGLQSFSNLEILYINSWFTNNVIDVSGLPNLEYLQVNNENNASVVPSINLTGLPVLKNLVIRCYGLDSLDVSSVESLEILSVGSQNLQSLELGELPNIIELGIGSDYIESFDLSNWPTVENFNISSHTMHTLSLEGCPNLNQVDIIEATALENLTIGYQPSLFSFYLDGNVLPSLDFSGCTAANTIFLNMTPNTYDGDIYINIKNGNLDGFVPWFGISDAYTVYICSDENDEFNFGDTTFNHQISTYCDLTPGGIYNTITGNVILDADNNGCDGADVALPFINVQLSDGSVMGYSSGSNGGYNFYTQEGTFTLTPQLDSNYFTISPATVTFADNNYNTTTQNFCVTANGVHNDVEALIVPIEPARPGFDAVYKIVYTNKGNQTLSGDVTFTYDDTVLDYVSASPVEASSATGSLTWSYSNLLPFESREIMVTLNVNSPMETPAVNIDDVLDFTVAVTPTAGDETAWDNTFGLNQVVVGSFDPNDITCLEGTAISPNYIGQYLRYNINFENTGTYPATFVVVKDVIDQTQFDVSTLQLIDASHDVEARVTGNKVEFYFNDINLAANGGKGNVAFKIKSLGTLQVNDDVTQQAEIFFDYNWPIVTNEATTVFSVLSNPGFDKDTTIKVYPNPTGNTVTISAQSELKHVALYDLQGRLLQAVTANGTQATLDLSGRAGGAYFIKTVTEKGADVEKVMKM